MEPSTLQSLQQLIQWVADLALNLLARLPEQRMQVKTGGVSIFYQSIYIISIYYISFECLFFIAMLQSLRIDNIVKKNLM